MHTEDRAAVNSERSEAVIDALERQLNCRHDLTRPNATDDYCCLIALAYAEILWQRNYITALRAAIEP